MASLQDTAEQINVKLDAINANTAATATNTQATAETAADIRSEAEETNNRLAAIRGELNAGFTNLSQGLFAIVELQREANNLLDHHREQNDTIICELVNGNELLCEISRKLTQMIVLDEAALRSTLRTEGILERVHPGEAADYDRNVDLHAKIEDCCPPPEDKPEPCPEPCEQPKFDPRDPKGQDWEPLRPQRPVG